MPSINKVQPLIDRARRLEREIAQAEARVKELKADYRRLLDSDIPSLMDELGLSEVRTKDGLLVQVVPFVDARIPRAKQAEALAWLREHGYGDLIKHEVKAAFGSGDDELARAAERYLEEIGAPISVKEAVHPQTLKAWAREQLEAGNEVPEDLFGLYTGETTRIKEVK